jgi:hypothetical protein
MDGRTVAGGSCELLEEVMGRGKGSSTPDLSDDATGEGLRQFWMHLPKHPEQVALSKALLNRILNLQI